jgi:hypothetical protein
MPLVEAQQENRVGDQQDLAPAAVGHRPLQANRRRLRQRLTGTLTFDVAPEKGAQRKYLRPRATKSGLQVIHGCYERSIR